MFNRVCLIGNLGADPEIKYAQSGTCIANIRLAVNDKRRDSTGNTVEETYWFNATAFGKTAEVLANFSSKGSKLGIDGKLIQRNWEDNNGNKRQSVEIRIDSVELISSPNHHNGHSQGSDNQNRGQDQGSDQGRRAGGSRGGYQQDNRGGYDNTPPPPPMDDGIPF